MEKKKRKKNCFSSPSLSFLLFAFFPSSEKKLNKMRLATYLRFCALLALLVLATAQPRTRREREAEQAAADAAAAAAAQPPAMTWAKPDAAAPAPTAADAKKAVAAPAPAPAKAEPAPKPSKDAPKGAAKGFIRVSGNKFVDEKCGDFIPIGWNCEFGVGS